MNLINLRGWPKPAGWNSGRPVGSVVPIRSAPAPQWFIYLIGMNSKEFCFPSLALLASPSHPPLHNRKHAYALLDELFILIKEKEETHLSELFSQVRAHLWDAHGADSVSAFRHINETVGRLMCHLQSFTPFLFPPDPFRVVAGWSAFRARTATETFLACYFNTTPSQPDFLSAKWQN